MKLCSYLFSLIIHFKAFHSHLYFLPRVRANHWTLNWNLSPLQRNTLWKDFKCASQKISSKSSILVHKIVLKRLNRANQRPTLNYLTFEWIGEYSKIVFEIGLNESFPLKSRHKMFRVLNRKLYFNSAEICNLKSILPTGALKKFKHEAILCFSNMTWHRELIVNERIQWPGGHLWI